MNCSLEANCATLSSETICEFRFVISSPGDKNRGKVARVPGRIHCQGSRRCRALSTCCLMALISVKLSFVVPVREQFLSQTLASLSTPAERL